MPTPFHRAGYELRQRRARAIMVPLIIAGNPIEQQRLNLPPVSRAERSVRSGRARGARHHMLKSSITNAHGGAPGT